FHDWIASITVAGQTSVKQFANAIQTKARVTFKEMPFFLKNDGFWKSHTNLDFMAYALAGFSGDVPEVCTVILTINRERTDLEYPELQCATPTWTRAGSFRYIPLYGTEHGNIDLSSQAGTPQAIRKTELWPVGCRAAATLFPDAPLGLQQ